MTAKPNNGVRHVRLLIPVRSSMYDYGIKKYGKVRFRRALAKEMGFLASESESAEYVWSNFGVKRVKPSLWPCKHCHHVEKRHSHDGCVARKSNGKTCGCQRWEL